MPANDPQPLVAARAFAVDPALHWRSPAAALLLATLGPLTFVLLTVLWRTPYGIGETVAILEDVERASLSRLLGMHGPYFRPGFWLTLRLLWEGIPFASESLLYFKLLHLGIVFTLIAGFVMTLRPRTAIDGAAALLAATVLVGSGGFRENLENLPLNQMLVVMLLAVVAWSLVERTRTRSTSVLLIACSLLALSFKEQGLVVIAAIVCARCAGAPGVSRRVQLTLLGMTVAYLSLRVWAMAEWPTFGQAVGVGFTEWSPDEASARLGSAVILLYAYNVFATASQVLFSEPTRGVLSISAAVFAGTPTASQLIHLLTSAALSVIVALWGWHVWRQRDETGLGRTLRLASLTQGTARQDQAGHSKSRREAAEHDRSREDRHDAVLLEAARERRHLVFFVVTLAASASLGFNYTRDRFGGVALIGYAAAAYFALRWLIACAVRARTGVLVAAACTLTLLACGWQTRAIGTVQGAREAAWSIRREWLIDVPDRRVKFEGRDTYQELLTRLYLQGSNPAGADAPREPQWFSRLLGDW